MTDRTFGLLDEILTAIVERIRAQVPELDNAGKCFLALNPDQPPAATTGEFFAIVSPTSGTFNFT